MDAQTLDSLAKGLTEAGRRVVLFVRKRDDWFAASDVSAPGVTMGLLVRIGLFERRSDPKVWGRSQYRWLPLGLALRDHLLAKGEGHG